MWERTSRGILDQSNKHQWAHARIAPIRLSLRRRENLIVRATELNLVLATSTLIPTRESIIQLKIECFKIYIVATIYIYTVNIVNSKYKI